MVKKITACQTQHIGFIIFKMLSRYFSYVPALHFNVELKFITTAGKIDL